MSVSISSFYPYMEGFNFLAPESRMCHMLCHYRDGSVDQNSIRRYVVVQEKLNRILKNSTYIFDTFVTASIFSLVSSVNVNILSPSGQHSAIFD